MKLIYIMDPLCGWCYGNSDNITTIYEHFNNDFHFELLTGGMWVGQNAQIGGEKLAQFILNHAPRMAEYTGVNIGQEYYDLSKNPAKVFSSLEPCAAIVCFKDISNNQAFNFAKKVQEKLFLQGKDLSNLETYLQILEEMEVDSELFAKRWMAQENVNNTIKEFSKAHFYAKGFPTLIAQMNNQSEVLASGYFKREQMMELLESLKND